MLTQRQLFRTIVRRAKSSDKRHDRNKLQLAISPQKENTSKDVVCTKENYGSLAEKDRKTEEAQISKEIVEESATSSFAVGKSVSPSQEDMKISHRKTLTFNREVHCCLVPNRSEMRPLLKELYWAFEDYSQFKDEAIKEIRSLLLSGNYTAKQAKTILYQPIYQGTFYTTSTDRIIDTGQEEKTSTTQQYSDYSEHRRVPDLVDSASSHPVQIVQTSMVYTLYALYALYTLYTLYTLYPLYTRYTLYTL